MSYMKVLNAGFAMMTSALTKILGAQVLKDAQTFVTAFDTMFGGFRERAEGTYRLLQAPGTAFLVIAAPEPDALREASYFVERLDAERMPLAGLILNRVHTSPAGRLSAARSLAAAETLEMQDRPNGAGASDGSAPRYTIAVAALRHARGADAARQTGTTASRALHRGSPGDSRRRGGRAARGRPRPSRAAGNRHHAVPAGLVSPAGTAWIILDLM